MRRALIAVSLATAITQLTGCFFFYVPGSVTGKISDAVTGSEGENCVTTTAKVGDKISLPGGSIGTITSLSGTSSRCGDAALPIRAKIVPDAPGASPVVANAAPVPDKDKIAFTTPTGYTANTLTAAQKAANTIAVLVNHTLDVGVAVIAEARSGITDTKDYAQTKQGAQMSRLSDSVRGDFSSITVSGRPAFQYEVTGTVSGKRLIYLTVVIEGQEQIVTVNSWCLAVNYDVRKEHMAKLGEIVTAMQ
jgi:hypothetical protein